MQITTIRCDGCGADMETTPEARTVTNGVGSITVALAEGRDTCPRCLAAGMARLLVELGSYYGAQLSERVAPRRGFFANSLSSRA